MLNTTDNELIFRLLYSAADLLVMPSKLESFGQTIIEAGSCNTPSIGFKNTGAQESIKHKETGYLAKPYDFDELAYGINWIISNKMMHVEMRIKSRKNALLNWSP